MSWTARARLELDVAIAWLSSKSPMAAARLRERLDEVAGSLAESSERGRLVPEVRRLGYREIIVWPYRLIYEVRPTRVLIVSVRHGARRLSRDDFVRERCAV